MQVISPIAVDVISRELPMLKLTVFKNAPKKISRNPSVKNLKKLLKKYDWIILPTLFLNHSAQTTVYEITKHIKARIDRPREKMSEAQFSRNNGLSIPKSEN